jgi:D-xylose transport system substrate-binding protein
MRKARGLAFVLAAASALAATSAACTSTTTQSNSGGTNGTSGAGYQRKTKKPGEPVYIGFSMDTLKEERWNRDKDLVTKRGEEVGARVEVQVANGDDAVQTNQCATFITKGVDVLIVAPHNGEIAASIVDRAHAAGIPVISYDRLIRNSEPDLYVSHQVVKMGEMQGDYALKHVPKGNYVLIGGAPTDNNALLLRQGQENVLKPAAERGDIHIISNQFAKEWKAEEAQRLTEDALTKTKDDIQAVVASNDGTAGGAISAIEAAGLTGKVLVTGQDAQLDAVQRIAKGTQTMTIYKPIKPLADSAVDAALKLAYNQPLNAPDKINNGRADVPSILQEPQAVDKANLDDTIIKDGYHKCEDVYKDVQGHQCPKATASGGRRATTSPLAAALTLLLTCGPLLIFKVAE